MVPTRSRGEIDVTTNMTGAQHLKDVLDKRPNRPYEGSGCGDHVNRRHLLVSVAGALIGIALLVTIMII